MDKAVVRNAADREQVTAARKKEALTQANRDERLKRLLASEDFRGYIWEVLEECKVFESIMETSARVYYNAGRQDVGHEIMGEIVRVSPETFIRMMQERNNA
jgi:hypothetical protein